MSDIESWVSGYEEAWRAPGTDALAKLFSPDATYIQGPFEEPVEGLEAIKAMWDAERPEGERFEFEHELVATERGVSVVRAHVRYTAPNEQEWRDLWVVALGPDNRCTHFEEWPFARP